jgi:hypothetical protein
MTTTTEQTEAAVVARIEERATALRAANPKLTKEQAFTQVLTTNAELRAALAQARCADRTPPPVDDAVQRFAHDGLTFLAYLIRQEQPQLSEAQAYVAAMERSPTLVGFLRGG